MLSLIKYTKGHHVNLVIISVLILLSINCKYMYCVNWLCIPFIIYILRIQYHYFNWFHKLVNSFRPFFVSFILINLLNWFQRCVKCVSFEILISKVQVHHVFTWFCFNTIRLYSWNIKSQYENMKHLWTMCKSLQTSIKLV